MRRKGGQAANETTVLAICYLDNRRRSLSLSHICHPRIVSKRCACTTTGSPQCRCRSLITLILKSSDNRASETTVYNEARRDRILDARTIRRSDVRNRLTLAPRRISSIYVWHFRVCGRGDASRERGGEARRRRGERLCGITCAGGVMKRERESERGRGSTRWRVY